MTTIREQVTALFAKQPKLMTMQVARELGVPEVEVIRALPTGRAVELDMARWQEIFQALAELGSVHVIVTNAAATLECTGEFGNFSMWGEFFNVQTATLDMHIRWANLGACFAMQSPSHVEGLSVYAVHFFDKAGQAAIKVLLSFGGRPLEPDRLAQFEALRAAYRLHA